MASAAKRLGMADETTMTTKGLEAVAAGVVAHMRGSADELKGEDLINCEAFLHVIKKFKVGRSERDER